jgi:hypothetical protein
MRFHHCVHVDRCGGASCDHKNMQLCVSISQNLWTSQVSITVILLGCAGLLHVLLNTNILFGYPMLTHARMTADRSSIIDHQSSIINHQSSIIDHQSSIINHRSSVINHQSSIINHRSSIINHRSPIIDHKSSTINHQASIFDHQSSIINHHSSIIDHRCAPFLM